MLLCVLAASEGQNGPWWSITGPFGSCHYSAGSPTNDRAQRVGQSIDSGLVRLCCTCIPPLGSAEYNELRWCEAFHPQKGNPRTGRHLHLHVQATTDIDRHRCHPCAASPPVARAAVLTSSCRACVLRSSYRQSQLVSEPIFALERREPLQPARFTLELPAARPRFQLWHPCRRSQRRDPGWPTRGCATAASHARSAAAGRKRAQRCNSHSYRRWMFVLRSHRPTHSVISHTLSWHAFTRTGYFSP